MTIYNQSNESTWKQTLFGIQALKWNAYKNILWVAKVSFLKHDFIVQTRVYAFNILYNIFCISEKEENMFVELNICCDKMHEIDIK